MLQKFIIKRLSLFSLLMLTSAQGAYAAEIPRPKWNPWIDAEGKIGDNRSIGIVDAFAPVWQDQDSLVFFNPRFRFDDQNSREYNIGAGYRERMNDWVLGGYGFADRNRSPSGNMFNQVTLGAEALGLDYKFRFNHYQPFGDRRKTGAARVVTIGSSLMIDGGIETSLTGNDIEVGYRIPIKPADDLNQLWGYVGAYRFDASGVKDITGPRARVEYNIGSVALGNQDLRLRLSGEIQHDSVRDTNYFVGMRIGIPLNGSSSKAAALSPLERHMIDPVERDIDIVVGESREAAINPLTGSAVGSVHVLRANDDLQARIDAAGNNAVLVFDGSQGNFGEPDLSNPGSAYLMHNGQAFIGAGGSLILRGANSGVTAAYRPTGTAATLNNIQWIELARNNAISGLTLTAPVNGILGSDVGNFSVTYTTISGATSVSEHPVSLTVTTPATITIDHNHFLNNETGAVVVNMGAGVTTANLSFTNNVATNNDTGTRGVGLGSAFVLVNNGVVGDTTLTMSGNTVTGGGGSAFYSHTGNSFASFTGIFDNNDFSNNNGSGIVFATPTTDASLTITNNTLSHLNDHAINIAGGGVGISNLDLVVSHNLISDVNNSGNGIAISGINNQLDMQITHNTIDDVEGSGILSYHTSIASLSISGIISNNTITNSQNLGSNAGGGIDIEGTYLMNLEIAYNTLSNNVSGSVIGYDGIGTACVNMYGNTSTDNYTLYNLASGIFNLAPTNFASSNSGSLNTVGTITPVASCP